MENKNLIEEMKELHLVNMNIRPRININPDMNSVYATLSHKDSAGKFHTFNINGATVKEV